MDTTHTGQISEIDLVHKLHFGVPYSDTLVFSCRNEDCFVLEQLTDLKVVDHCVMSFLLHGHVFSTDEEADIPVVIARENIRLNNSPIRVGYVGQTGDDLSLSVDSCFPEHQSAT